MKLTRRELYDWVWSIPVTKVAAVLKISGSALAKTCRNHRIPTPERGYWRRLQVGQITTRTPLPEPDDDGHLSIQVDEAVLSAMATAQATQVPVVNKQRPSIKSSGRAAGPLPRPRAAIDRPKPLAEDRVVDRSTAVCGERDAGSVDPSWASLARLSSLYGEHLAVERLLDGLQRMAVGLDPATAAVLLLWRQSAKQSLLLSDPTLRIVESCRRIAAGTERPAWWTSIQGHAILLGATERPASRAIDRAK